ncbi:alpha-N-acetylglucosaminidase [Prevotella aff. ruminicola Tc2-24]|uniref:Alpha-N-acetylglucosaminidase n=1 Tax=Prevotella aff. ruminicola Tc2-24 TaxID=81582 RepID=A0A1I0NVV7_9BACT|nr:alpha-N-acetylglucosaminidase [Prevotella aff. ruminicola Tc2-24]SEW05953.1 alpha-N-acetylglucosaminidase [Prevotella aff. ruminicola Tc2-24]
MRKLLTIVAILLSMQVWSNPVDDLLERIDKGASAKFKIERVKSQKDFFELDQQGRRVVVRGNTWVNIASGVNWYLKYYASIHLSWNQMQAKLPVVLPAVKQRERHETDLSQRYAFNYCTFSYSMAFWDWKRWEQEIDWLALHGVNLPLAIVGEECVWRHMLLRLGYTEQEVGAFIAGPAFLAWWEMNNLEGWGGPLPLSWYTRQEQLQKQILTRMKQLDMHPVLPGYCGMVPHDAKEKLGLNVADAGLWNGFQRPANLLPTDPRFAEIAKIYYEELTRLFGKADYYSMDPFHESSDDASINYAKAGEAMMTAMKRVNPKAVWVIQGWTENPRPAMVDGMKAGDLLVLDLFSECRPMFGIPSIWRREQGYKQHHWLFCMLENFGANVGLHGRMDQLLDNFYSTEHTQSSKFKVQSPKGIGFTMEGSENNPVMFELMSELPWRPEKFAKETWVKNYVKARYGVDDPVIEQAWMILAKSIYNCPAGNNQQGPHESIFCGRPSLNNFQASSWSKMKNYYDPSDTREAARLMNSVAEKYRGNNNFEYDLVDITRQALADQARLQYQHTIADYKAFARQGFDKDAQRFLKMLLMQDKLLGTRSEFRLGHWTEAARRCGTTSEEKELYEWNARVQITTWGNRYCADTGGLRDYAHKEWQGLLKDFYYVRWKTYFDALMAQMQAQTAPQPELLGGGPHANKTAAELFQMALPQEVRLDYYAMEEPWTLQHNPYSAVAEGSPVDIAREVMQLLLPQ